MEETYQSILDAPRAAVDLVIGLVGGMVFFLGLLNVAREAGLLAWLARKLYPLMRRLFPDVPEDHPAMSAMIMNIAANMMGLDQRGDAVRASRRSKSCDKPQHGRKGTATDSPWPCSWRSTPRASLALLPLGSDRHPYAKPPARADAARESSSRPWFASGCATIVAVISAAVPAGAVLALLSQEARTARSLPVRRPGSRVHRRRHYGCRNRLRAGEHRRRRAWTASRILAGVHCSAVGGAGVRAPADHSRRPTLDLMRQVILRTWILPADRRRSWCCSAWSRRVQGLRVGWSAVPSEGFQVAVRIIPFLVAILDRGRRCSRESGAMGYLLIDCGRPAHQSQIGLPAEALPMAVLRPLSRFGRAGRDEPRSMNTYGPDSLDRLSW